MWCHDVEGWLPIDCGGSGCRVYDFVTGSVQIWTRPFSADGRESVFIRSASAMDSFRRLRKRSFGSLFARLVVSTLGRHR